MTERKQNDGAPGPKRRLEIDPALPVIRGHRRLLREVLSELIDNAIKFMGSQPHPRIELGCRRDRGETVLYVRDNGIGIDQRYREQVFGLFDRLDPPAEGTGIGLARGRKIVELHGGRIWIESGGGQGSTFCFTLMPAAASRLPASGRTGGEAEAPA